MSSSGWIMDAHQYTSVMYVIYGTHEQTSKIKLLLIHVFTQSTFLVVMGMLGILFKQFLFLQIKHDINQRPCFK